MNFYFLHEPMKQFFTALLMVLVLKPVHSDSGFWTGMSIHQETGSYLHHLDAELRFNEGGRPVDQFLGDIGAGYRLKPHWQVWLGSKYSYNDQDTVSDVQEIRLWEQLSFLQKDFMIRSRLEQRKAFTEPAVANRLREKIEWSAPLQQLFKLKCYDELFINLNQVSWVRTRTFDQNRFFLGVAHQASKQLQVSLGFLYQSVFSTPVENARIVKLSFAYRLQDS